MGVQLIFVVEANKSCKSDWIYIKSTIDYFYEYNRTGLKLSPVYMDRTLCTGTNSANSAPSVR